MKKITDIKKGDKFDELTTISEGYIKKVGKSTYRYFFDVQCSCGNNFKTTASYLRNKTITKCRTCALKYREKGRIYVPQIEQMYNHNIILRCKYSNIENNLSLKEYSQLAIENCFYCGEEPKEIPKFNRNKLIGNNSIKINTIDRIDSSKGYSINNCVACCKQCNTIKMDMNLKDFIEKICKIYKNKDKISEYLDNK